MDTTVSARMDANLKSEAEAVLEKLGITHTAAINALYSQVVLQQGLPFELRVPEAKKPKSVQSIKRAIFPLAKQYGVERIYLFGSYAREEATHESDIDLRIDPGNMKGFAIGGFLQDAEEALGVKIDIATSKSLSKKFRDKIAREEILLYERKGS